MVLAVLVCAGCKDKKPEHKPSDTKRGEHGKAPGERPTLESPDVEGPGLIPVTRLSGKLTYAKDEIRVNDEPVISIGADGLIDPDRFNSLMRILEDKVRSDDPLGIALDASIPYHRLGVLISRLKRGGFRNLALLAGNGSTMIPLELPETRLASAGGVRPVVTLQSERLILWSLSGEEGNKGKPKFSMSVTGGASLSPLTSALAEIVQRRWSDGKRPPADRTIVVQLGAHESAQQLLRLLAAVRSSGSLELFPNIFLASST